MTNRSLFAIAVLIGVLGGIVYAALGALAWSMYLLGAVSATFCAAIAERDDN